MSGERFAVKFKGQVAAGSVQVAEVLDHVEAKMAEDELQEDDYAQMAGVEGLDDDKLVEIGHAMHNLLLNLTTGEANAVVRRCRGCLRLEGSQPGSEPAQDHGREEGRLGDKSVGGQDDEAQY